MYDLVVIGGGPAGLAAAYEAYQNGLQKVAIIERDRELGGILNQCIHNGFGLHYFKEELTGPEYTSRFIQMVKNTEIENHFNTMVLDITKDKEVHCISKERGYQILKSRSIVLSMGCRERTRGAIGIPGTRPSGVFTAGTAQRFVNMEGYMVGKKVVILGSGDIGLIMARRMTLEGAEVLACVEVLPYSGGLNRNIVQCLEDYNIPLYLSHTIVEIKGDKRVEEVVVAKVDENRIPIKGTEFSLSCDTVLLSVGLIPENELSKKMGIQLDKRTKGAFVNEQMQTSIPGVFACGNVVHVHDLVDFVTEEAQKAGKAAALYVLSKHAQTDEQKCVIENGNGVAYTIPQTIQNKSQPTGISILLRVNRIFGQSVITVHSRDKVYARFQRERLAPGEMEKIVLPPKILQNISENTLSVSVEE